MHDKIIQSFYPPDPDGESEKMEEQNPFSKTEESAEETVSAADLPSETAEPGTESESPAAAADTGTVSQEGISGGGTAQPSGAQGMPAEENGKPEEYTFMNQTIRKKPVSRKPWIIRICTTLALGVLAGVIAAFVFAKTLPVAQRITGTQQTAAKVEIPGDEDPAAAVPDQAAVPASSKSGSSDSTDNSSDTVSLSAAAGSAETSSVSADSGTEPTDSSAESVSADSTEEVPAAVSAESSSIEDNPASDPEKPGTDGDPESGGEPGQPDEGTDGSSTSPGAEMPLTAEERLQEYRTLHQDMLQVAADSERALVSVIGISNEMDYFNQNYESRKQVAGMIVAQTLTDLYVLTEYRVVEKVERIQVTFCNGDIVDAIFQKADENTGLAVLKVSLSSVGLQTRDAIKLAPLGNSFLTGRGEPVLALGSPLGYADSVAVGIITSVTNKVSMVDTEYNLLTTDIEGSKDGSGILVNLEGKIVGVIWHGTADDGSTINALAVSQIKSLIENLSNNEPRRYAGLTGREVTGEISERTGIPKGVLITEIRADSPAMLAGLKQLDVIVEVGGVRTETMRAFSDVLQRQEAGTEVSLTAMRKGAQGYVEVEFTLVPSEQ